MLISINWIEKSSIVRNLCLSPRTAKLLNASKKLVRILELIQFMPKKPKVKIESVSVLHIIFNMVIFKDPVVDID